MRDGSCGLAVAPNSGFTESHQLANSETLVLPSRIAPAARIARDRRAVRVADVIGEQLRTVRRAHAGDRERVLARERHAVERPARRHPVGRHRLLARLVEPRQHERVDRRIALGDPRRVRLEQLERGDLALAHGASHPRRRLLDQCRHVATLARSRAHVTRRGADDPRARALPRRASALARAGRGGGAHAARRRADALDGPLARRLPGLRGAREGRALHRRRRPRVRRPLPRRHRRDDRPRARADAARDRRAGAARDHADAAERGRAVGRARRCSGASGCRRGSSRSPPPTPTASRSGSPARSPGGRRSSCSTGATTAPSTRRSRRSTPTATSSRARATSARRCRSPRPRASSSSTTSRRCERGARPRRRRVRARRAGAHQHRHRAAGARLPRRAARGHARDRDAADHRRDAHALGRPRRLHARPTASSPTC